MTLFYNHEMRINLSGKKTGEWKREENEKTEWGGRIELNLKKKIKMQSKMVNKQMNLISKAI